MGMLLASLDMSGRVSWLFHHYTPYFIWPIFLSMGTINICFQRAGSGKYTTPTIFILLFAVTGKLFPQWNQTVGFLLLRCIKACLLYLKLWCSINHIGLILWSWDLLTRGIKLNPTMTSSLVIPKSFQVKTNNAVGYMTKPRATAPRARVSTFATANSGN